MIDEEYNDSELGNIAEGEVIQINKEHTYYLSLSADSNEDIKDKVNNLKGNTSVQLRKAVRMIITNCLSHAGKGNTVLRYKRSTDNSDNVPKNYNKNNITNAMVIKAVDALVKLGFLENTVAPQSFGNDKAKGKAIKTSYITPTSALFEYFGCATNIEDSIRSVEENTEVVVLKNKEGDVVSYKNNDTSNTTRGMLQLYNTNSKKFAVEVDGTKLKTDMKAIFKVDFDSYGRIYGAHYQNMPKETRLRLTINGEACAEIDFSNLHLRMLHDIYNLAHYIDGIEDLYSLPLKDVDIKKDDRTLIKMATLILINSKSDKTYLQALQGHMNLNTYDTTFSSARQLYDTLKQAYPWLLNNTAIMANIFNGTAPLAAKLQRLDAAICLNVVTTLAEDDIMVGAIHDSFLCRQSDVAYVSRLVGDSYRKEMNVDRRIAATLSYGENVISTLI